MSTVKGPLIRLILTLAHVGIHDSKKKSNLPLRARVLKATDCQ